jgi:ATP-binding cassette subfamily F protein 3
MPAVQLNEVSIAFGARRVLDAVTFRVARGDKTALAGANGSGKSTLMKIMAGLLPPDSGQAVREKETRVSYLPQSGVVHRERSLWEEAELAFGWAEALIAERLRLEERLGAVSQDAEAQRLLARHHEVQEKLAESGYYGREERIERVLAGLGFRRSELHDPSSRFSGGWQMRIALARVLLEEPDILLLDEPTNYLDLEARDWLEDYLVRFRGGVLVVSHDRYFLDATVQGVAELYLGALSFYPGTFSRYEERRRRELAEIGERYRRQQEEIERTESFIRRFRYNASKAALVQSRIRQLERVERIEVPPMLKRIHFSFPPAPRSGKRVLWLEGVGKSYGEVAVLKDLDLELSAGERLVLVGPNGAGKSTLMRLAAGEEKPDSGEIHHGHNVSIGYYAQDHADRLEGPASVAETAESWAPTELMPHLRTLLGAFLFRGEEIDKPVSVLSGGEKSRLAVLRLLLHPANLLVLDEPTNHMDLASKDILLDALRQFSGTLIFVSHDRHFIDRLATRVLELKPCAAGNASLARLYPGDYAYYLYRREQEEREAGAAPAPGPSRADTENLPAAEGRITHQAGKRLKGSIRRLEREEEALVARIDALQRETRELEQAMGREDVYRDGEEMRRIKLRLEENAREQEELARRWEEVDRERRSLEAGAGGP